MSAQEDNTDEECEAKQIPVWSHGTSGAYTSDAVVVGSLKNLAPVPRTRLMVPTPTCWTSCRGVCASGEGDEFCTVPTAFERLLEEVRVEHVRELEELRACLKGKADEWSTDATPGVKPVCLEPHSQWRSSVLQRRVEVTSAVSAGISANEALKAPPQALPEIKSRMPSRFGSGALAACDISSEATSRRHGSKDDMGPTFSGPDEVVHSNISSELPLESMSTHMPPIWSLQRFLKWLVKRQAFDVVSCTVIILNAFLLGIETELGLENALNGKEPDDLPAVYGILNRVFTAWFMTELCMRFFAQGPREFVAGEEWTWNLFDAFVVFTDFLDVALSSTLAFESREGTLVQNLAVVRMLRIMRLTRAIRIVRLIRFFKSLRMMVYSVLLSTSSLLWSLLMLLLTICIFSIYFVQIVSYHLHTVNPLPSADSSIRSLFGSLGMTCYTLYLAVSGGISWGEVGQPLFDIDWFHGMVLCFFTFFTTFALLNIITGIFVDTAIRSAESDKDYVIQETLHSTKRSLEELRQLFIIADLDRSGSITLPELEAQLRKKEVGAHLRSIGIEVGQARSLFKLLDLDGSGEITIEEFVCGCMRLKGAAKSLDLATIMYENRRMAEQWRRFFVWSDHKFQQQARFEQRVEEQLAMLVR
mmetsp:Transcript_21150/g.49136  ORF Transcript_21150/g.49136 Transcript_21150/m.49136 type:complete len:645 (+) Transcript_21150:67-2001(+)